MTTALCCLPTWVWLCAFWLVLGSPGVCAAALQWQFDGVLLPILPSLNRSCCHLYFDLCIPWSIYACEWWEGRRGGRGEGGVEKRKTATTTILAVIPEGTPAVHLPFKSFSTDRHSTEADDYKPPHVNRNSVLVLFAQTKKGFFQLRPGSMKRVKRCCSPLWELQKAKAREKLNVTAVSESCTDNSDQTVVGGGRVCTQFVWFYLPLRISEKSRGKPHKGSTSTGTGRWKKPTYRHCGSYIPTLYMSRVKSDFLDLPSACQTRNWRSAVWPLWKVNELWLIHRGVCHGVWFFFRTSCESVNCSNMFQDVKLVLDEPDDSPIRAKNKRISVQKEQWL